MAQTERKASIRNTVRFVTQSIGFDIERSNEALFLSEKVVMALKYLKPSKLRELMLIKSSVNHGAWVFDQAYPGYDNPDDFHSTEHVICLDENPIQVLGWDDCDELKQEGVDEGLRLHWIEYGFKERSIEKGIDLEWHFFHTPLQEQETNQTQQKDTMPPLLE